ncbi:MAG: type II toxin-antitoxin system RelB/DinJ family antitoxin [Lachnospiraceae bacterium]|nr:type II toxin-antitoxin system RelB/DinJ family antitoxin [Lachnospiraceae bacterium]MBD5504916.1 type II toxin-antitoxin system RelB/DinJ family antitoxin [Lachnospiraceae bacterium]
MATLQIRIDDSLKKEADTLFASLGLDTSTAIRIFLNAAIENAGIPFSVQHKTVSDSLQEAIYDSRFKRNLNGPFDNAADAVASMLED